MITKIKENGQERRPLSWYKEQLQACVERERLNHSYKRNIVLEALYDLTAPVSVERLYFILIQEGGNRISINTVYRIIKLLVSCDIVMRFETNGSPRYLLNSFEGSDVTLVCRNGGKRIALDMPAQWRFELEKMLKNRGVEISGSIELRVDCNPDQ